MDLPMAELAERYTETAADCAAWAREARKRRRAALEAGDREEADLQGEIARNWSGQARQLRRDAAAMRGGQTVGIKSRCGGAAKKSVPPRLF